MTQAVSGAPHPSVLLVHHTFPDVVGGVETVMRYHVAGLRSVAAVRVLAGQGSARIAGAETIRVPLVDARHPAIRRVMREIARGRTAADFDRLRGVLRDALEPHLRAADRVVLHNVVSLGLNLPLVAALHDLAPSLPPGRLIVWIHDLAAPGDSRPGSVRQLLARPVVGARYVAVSEQQRTAASGTLGLPVAAITVVSNGIDVPGVLRIAPTTARFVTRTGLRDADPLVLLPARLVRRKRIEVAVDAVNRLRQRGLQARLVVTGMPDPHDPDRRAYRRELLARVAAAGARDVLVHELTRRRVPFRLVADLYALADVVVLPSSMEGFGIPIAEAATARIPIVCTDLPVFRSIAGDVPTYVAPDADGTALADAIEVALAGAPAGRLAARLRAELDWERIVAEQVIPAILG